MRQPNLKSIATRICFRYLPIMALSLLFSIHVFANSTADIIPPVLNCPGTINIQLLPGECDAVVNYNVTATDNSDPNPTISLINGLAPGAAFSIGTTATQYQATDMSGNSSTCNFNIVVNEYNNGSTSIECESLVNLSLDNNCQAYVTPAYILQGLYGCYDNYSVQIVDANGNMVPQLINGNYLGQALTVTIIENATGLSCSGIMNVEDYSAPIIECNDAAIFCYEGTDPTDILNNGYPNVTDNCDTDIDLSYTDISTPLDCTVPINGGFFLSKIDRTWTATDNAGNSSTCTQTIYSKRVFVYDIDCPQNADGIKYPALDCSDNPNDLSITGQPTLNGTPVNDLTSCNLSVSYTDSIAYTCDGSYRIYRNWKMIDLCPDGETAYSYPYIKGIIDKIQVIDFLDTTPPVFTCIDTLSIGTSSNSCTGVLTIPAINVTDDCSNVTISVVTPDGIAHNANGGQIVSGLTIGTHEVVYVAKDGCGNLSSCTVPIVVHDCIAPEIACVADITVSINNTSNNEICGTQLDAGTTDNCSDITFEIRRGDALYVDPYFTCLYYDCEDVNTSFEIDMIAKDTYGNESECTATVYVIDDVVPTINCPADISVDCQADYEALTLTGIATAADNCGVLPFDYNDNSVFGTCGLNTIYRTFTVVDANGNNNTCEQKIVQINTNPFYISDTDATNSDPNDGVEWPANYSTDCGSTTSSILPASLPSNPVNYAQPKLSFYACDEIQLTYTDSLISGNINDCYSLARKWLIIDWCNYDPTNPTAGGTYEYIQTISVGDTEAPVFSGTCSDITVCNYDQNCGLTFAHLEANATDNCTADADLYYFYGIDLHNDGTIDVNGLGNTIDDLYPLGQHKVVFEVNDGCGNLNSCEYFFIIEDCVKPTPNCNQAVTFDLGNSPTYFLTTNELESGNSFDNCTAYNDLLFSFSNNTSETTFELNCAYLGTYNLELWATDQYGNQEKCSSIVTLTDVNGVCDINPEPVYTNISGYIQDEIGNMIEDVDVTINVGSTGMETTDMTGDYLFPGLPINSNYAITPTKDINILNGVSTLDLVLITRHILGIQSLTSPYKMIAADVNNSNSITTLDVVNLQRVILGIASDFPNNTSWRFVDMDFVFPTPTNPFASNFPEAISFNNLTSDELATDFIGVKIGDVNSSSTPSMMSIQNRNTNTFDFQINNQQLKKGEEYIIEITTDELDELLGYQLTLQLPTDKVELIEVIPGEVAGMDQNNFGTQLLDRGVVTANWYTPSQIDTKEQTVLFGLKVKAKTGVDVKDLMLIGDAPIVSEVYKQSEQGIDQYGLGFNFSNSDENVVLSQNEITTSPNPFKEKTTISFDLQQDDQVELIVFDLNGRVVLQQTENYTNGKNEVIVNSSELNGTGIYYFQLQSKEFSLTQKLIMID